MDKLEYKLNENYLSHYSRSNWSLDPNILCHEASKVFDAMYKPALDLIQSDGATVLDLGCGTGVLLSWLKKQPAIIAYGVDSSLPMVEVARKYLLNVNIECDDGLQYLKRFPGKFDAIFCRDVLEHITIDKSLDWILSIREALKDGGFLFCEVPNAACITGCEALYHDLTHKLIFTEHSIIQLFEASGLKNSYVIPSKARNLSGKLRILLNYLLHKIIYKINGSSGSKVFTRTLCAIGFK